jgi:2-oxoglutarate ferredoxin oxidoreductase subunit beta
MYRDLIRLDRFPTKWCPGCGIGQILIQLSKAMDQLGLDHTNCTIVTGIGCTGRLSGYVNIDTVYTLHGRTLPMAEAIKTVNPNLKVIVVSGDGDLASIGGNHLIHAARRNADITVICNNNQIYGLTGGQAGPTTPLGTRTVSTPSGAQRNPINLQNLIKCGAKYSYARTTSYHQIHMQKCIREAIEWPGFAFVEILSQCIENNGRRIGYNSAWEMLQQYKRTYKRAPRGKDYLEPDEIGTIHQA